jgi:hypothetical protein
LLGAAAAALERRRPEWPDADLAARALDAARDYPSAADVAPDWSAWF